METEMWRANFISLNSGLAFINILDYIRRAPAIIVLLIKPVLALSKSAKTIAACVANRGVSNSRDIRRFGFFNIAVNFRLLISSHTLSI